MVHSRAIGGKHRWVDTAPDAFIMAQLVAGISCPELDAPPVVWSISCTVSPGFQGNHMRPHPTQVRPGCQAEWLDRECLQDIASLGRLWYRGVTSNNRLRRGTVNRCVNLSNLGGTVSTLLAPGRTWVWVEGFCESTLFWRLGMSGQMSADLGTTGLYLGVTERLGKPFCIVNVALPGGTFVRVLFPPDQVRLRDTAGDARVAEEAPPRHRPSLRIVK